MQDQGQVYVMKMVIATLGGIHIYSLAALFFLF